MTNVLNTAMHTDNAQDIDFDLLKASADKASQLLKSLSHPDRLLLMCQLVKGDACVSELARLTGITQPSLSQQLGVLRDKNLVTTQRQSRQIFYSIASDDALAIMQILYQRFCQPPLDEPTSTIDTIETVQGKIDD